jgi:predicted permease
LSILLSIFINNLLPVFLIVGTGMLISATLRPDVKALSRTTFYTLTPSLAFSGLIRAELTGTETQQIAAFAAIAQLSTAALAWLIASLLRWNGTRRRALVLTVLIINAGNFGLSVVFFAFGAEAQAKAMVYFVTSAAIGNTLGTAVAAGGSSRRQMLSNVVRAPMLYATVGAMIVNAFDRIQIPELVLRPISLLANAAVPMMLLILGMQLAHSVRGLRKHFDSIILATIFRLLIAPFVALLVAWLTRVQGITFQTCMLEASTPSGVSSTVLSLEYDLEPDAVTGTVFFSTLCSALTLSVLISVVG